MSHYALSHISTFGQGIAPVIFAKVQEIFSFKYQASNSGKMARLEIVLRVAEIILAMITSVVYKEKVFFLSVEVGKLFSRQTKNRSPYITFFNIIAMTSTKIISYTQ